MLEPLARQLGEPAALVMSAAWAVAAALLAAAAAAWLRRTAEGYRSSYLADARKRLDEVFLDVPPERFLQLSIAGAALGFVIGAAALWDGGSAAGIGRALAAGLVLAAAASLAPRWVLARLRVVRRRRFEQQLVDALMTIGNALRAGFSIRQSFEMVVREGQNPIAQEFGLFLQQTRMGVRFEDALDALSRRVGSEDLDLTIVAIETARQTGGNVTEVFDRLAATIRERNRVQGRLRSLTAQGRLQAIVVGLMPAFLALALMVLDPDLIGGFFRSPLGMLLGLLVIVLEVSGFLLIRRIVTIDV